MNDILSLVAKCKGDALVCSAPTSSRGEIHGIQRANIPVVVRSVLWGVHVLYHFDRKNLSPVVFLP